MVQIVFPNRLEWILVKFFPILVLAHSSMTHSTPHVCQAYVSFTESRRATLTGKNKSDTIFQKFSNTYPTPMVPHLNSVYDPSNNSYLRLINGWIVEGFVSFVGKYQWESLCTGFEGRERNEILQVSRRLVRMILLSFLSSSSTKRTPLPF